MAHVLLVWVSVRGGCPEEASIIIPATTTWDPRSSILRTRFSGPAGIADVVSWRAGLYAAAALIRRGTSFKLLVDIRGYDVAAIDPSVHRVQREVIPIFLASHHFRTGFIDFFGVKGEISPSKEDALCTAVAHLHHEETKMNLYRQTLGRNVENFFSDLPEAEAWLVDMPWRMDEPLERVV